MNCPHCKAQIPGFLKWSERMFFAAIIGVIVFCYSATVWMGGYYSGRDEGILEIGKMLGKPQFKKSIFWQKQTELSPAEAWKTEYQNGDHR